MANESPAIVEVEDVHLAFGSNEVLRGVSFTVRRGETLCILGGSGGGKSTLLKAMVGIHCPQRGSIRLDGEDLVTLGPAGLDRARRKFGVTFQSGALLGSMTVAENIALPLGYHTRLGRETIETMVKIKLHQVDLLHAAELRPAELSGGMQKRAAIARALAMDPKILFHDEPSAGLDPIATSRIDALINQLKGTMGMTNVIVTHVMESVRRIADRVIMLAQGEVILDGSLEDLEGSKDPRVVQFRTGDLEGPATMRTSEDAYLRDLLL